MEQQCNGNIIILANRGRFVISIIKEVVITKRKIKKIKGILLIPMLSPMQRKRSGKSLRKNICSRSAL